MTSMSIRPASPDDLAYVRSTWREGHKNSPGAERMRWPEFKATVGKQIDAVLASPGVQVLAAYADNGRVIGWLAYTPGRSVSTVHWAHTRFELDGEPCRRRGVMTALLDRAELGKRFAYTFRGARRGGGARRPGRGDPLDLTLAAWLRGRGVTAVYVPVEEFL
jgi:hypothetical protein